MPLLGAHMSIAGGYFKAIESAARLGMDTVQIFTHSPSQWAIRPASLPVQSSRSKVLPNGPVPWISKVIPDEEVSRFRELLAERKLRYPLSHSSYLLNLASPDAALWQKSVDACESELRRAAQLGIANVVLHPGAHMSAGEDAGNANVITALNEVFRRTADIDCGVLLETTAGQGSSLGHRFEHLAAILAGVAAQHRTGVCFDTCHVFAAGYPMETKREYLATLAEFDRLIGVSRIQAFHLNDSKRECGSRVDRHEHIGRGKLGCEPFRHVLNDRRFRDLPMYLETPKGLEKGIDLDAINLKTLRDLIGRPVRRA